MDFRTLVSSNQVGVVLDKKVVFYFLNGKYYTGEINVDIVGKFVLDVFCKETGELYTQGEERKILVNIKLLNDGRKHVTLSSNVAIINHCSDNLYPKVRECGNDS